MGAAETTGILRWSASPAMIGCTVREPVIPECSAETTGVLPQCYKRADKELFTGILRSPAILNIVFN
jgi:hypothetical protein